MNQNPAPSPLHVGWRCFWGWASWRCSATIFSRGSALQRCMTGYGGLKIHKFPV